MATVIRAEVSERNKYWIDKHRHYELKHFCLQYPRWKRLYLELDGLQGSSFDPISCSKLNIPSDPTLRLAENRELYFDKMKLIEQTAVATDVDLASYIIAGVTNGLSYSLLKSRMDIPCCRDTYYDRYRRFFWLLDKIRN